MAIYISFFKEGWVQNDHSSFAVASFASFGEAAALCSRAPYYGKEKYINFGFVCDPAYTVQEFLTAGSLGT